MTESSYFSNKIAHNSDSKTYNKNYSPTQSYDT